MCSILEDEVELFTISEFQTMMKKQQEKVYSSLMTKKKLQEKHKDEISFVTKNGKSDTNSALTEAWYNKRKFSKANEAESIIKAVAKLRLVFTLPYKILRTQ